MNDPDLFSSLIQLANSLGPWVIFMYLYIDERRQHYKTRDELTRRADAIQQAHMEDLREIAGMRTNLSRVSSIVRETRDLKPVHPPEQVIG